MPSIPRPNVIAGRNRRRGWRPAPIAAAVLAMPGPNPYVTQASSTAAGFETVDF